MSSTPDFNSPFKNQFKDPNNFEGDSFEVRSKVEESNTLSKISDRARKDKKIAKNLDKAKDQLKSKQFHRKLAGTETVYVRRTRE